MQRTEVNVQTGEVVIVDLSPEEEAAVIARAQADEPDRINREADAAAHAAAKEDAVIQYLVKHTPAECESYVQANVNNLAEAKVVLGKMAMVLSVIARGKLR